MAALLLAVLCRAAPADDPEAHLLVLQNDKIVVGILPRIGGRVVLLRRPGGRNVFFSDPALWGDQAKDIPKPGPDSDYKFYFGHITWLGPQFHWWSQQDMNPSRRGQDWPPDPYLEFTDFRVTHRDRSHVVLVGPPDPVAGVRMTKEIRLDPDGIVHVRAEAVNKTPVSWELWSDTRVAARTPVYVPVPTDRWFRIQYGAGAPAASMVMPYEFRDGFFHFRNDTPFPDGINTMVAKAFLRPTEGVEAAFVGDNLFLKRAPFIPPEKVQPEEAFCELYDSISRGSDLNVLEMEMQGEFHPLRPGQSLRFEETWQVLPYDGASTPDAQIAFLKRLGLGKP